MELTFFVRIQQTVCVILCSTAPVDYIWVTFRDSVISRDKITEFDYEMIAEREV